MWDRYPRFVMSRWLPYFLVRVVGPSMEPSLTNGELWLARKSLKNLDVGRIIVFRHPVRPHLTQVKRVIRRHGSGWWVEGDNRDYSTDSRNFGEVPMDCIQGVLIRRI